MKASKMIKDLQDLVDRYGDLEVWYDGYTNEDGGPSWYRASWVAYDPKLELNMFEQEAGFCIQ